MTLLMRAGWLVETVDKVILGWHWVVWHLHVFNRLLFMVADQVAV